MRQQAAYVFMHKLLTHISKTIVQRMKRVFPSITKHMISTQAPSSSNEHNYNCTQLPHVFLSCGVIFSLLVSMFDADLVAYSMPPEYVCLHYVVPLWVDYVSVECTHFKQLLVFHILLAHPGGG
jgi:hypothetical protein